MVNELATGQPEGLPSGGAVKEVVGSKLSGAAQTYRRAMRDFAELGYQEFERLMNDLRTDCDKAVKSIDDISRQDEEIMMMLRQLGEGIPADSLPTGAGNGGGSTSW